MTLKILTKEDLFKGTTTQWWSYWQVIEAMDFKVVIERTKNVYSVGENQDGTW